jgi:long-subunit acyl-CoA synthetase (AMP-forming)
LLEDGRRRYADRALFGQRCGGVMRWTSFEQFAAGVATYAEQLAELGVRPGERVLIAGPWSLAAAQLAHAVSRRCASFVPLSEATDRGAWNFALGHAEARWAFALSPSAARTLESLAAELRSPLGIIDLEPAAARRAPSESIGRRPRADEVASRHYQRSASGKLYANALTHRALCGRVRTIFHTSGMLRRALAETLLLRAVFAGAPALRAAV